MSDEKVTISKEQKATYGIEETKAFLNSLVILVTLGKKIKEDGVKLESLTHLIAAVKRIDEIVGGLDDLNLVKKELMDLDHMEVVELISALYAAVKEVEKA